MSASASMFTPPRSAIFLLRAASAIALSKQADHPAANSCSGLVPMRADPGVESLTSRRPSELREAPFSRPPVVSVLAVYTTFAIRLMVHSFFEVVVPARGSRGAQGARRSFQVDLRSDLKPARTSSARSFGCSQAAKCPPLSTLL